MNILSQWYHRHEYRRSVTRVIRAAHAIEQPNPLAILDFCLDWLPRATFNDPQSLHGQTTVLIESRTSNVDTLIADIRDAVLDINAERELTAFGYLDRELDQRPYIMFMVDLDGFAVDRTVTRDLLVQAIGDLHGILGMSIASESDLALFYQRATHPLAVVCMKLTMLMLADSDTPQLYSLY